jgi:diadenosine tetraphosphate (Ap4A) HIT family hydrolase
MLIPKKHVGSMYELAPDDAPVMGRIMTLAGRLAREQGAADGFRTIVNTGRVGRQEVPHVHVHVIARFREDIAWPRPVWGMATAQPYSPDALVQRIRRLQDALNA